MLPASNVTRPHNLSCTGWSINIWSWHNIINMPQLHSQSGLIIIARGLLHKLFYVPFTCRSWQLAMQYPSRGWEDGNFSAVHEIRSICEGPTCIWVQCCCFFPSLQFCQRCCLTGLLFAIFKCRWIVTIATCTWALYAYHSCSIRLCSRSTTLWSGGNIWCVFFLHVISLHTFLNTEFRFHISFHSTIHSIFHLR